MSQQASSFDHGLARLGAQQIQHGPFDLAMGGAVRQIGICRSERQRDGDAVIEEIDQAWVDVGCAGDSRGVAEIARNFLHRCRNGTLAGADSPGPLIGLRQHHGCDHGAVPGTEVLGRHLIPEQVLEVAVDVVGADVVPLLPILVGEEFWPAALSCQQVPDGS